MTRTCPGGFGQNGWITLSKTAAAGLSACLCSCSEPVPAPLVTPDLITLGEAEKLGMEVAWQSAVAVTQRGKVTQIYPWEDILVTVEDGSNVLSAISTSEGKPLWDTPVGVPLERTLGLMRSGATIFAATQSECHLIDTASGRVTQQQSWGPGNVASTAPLLLGAYLVFGTEDGRVVYHNLASQMMQDAYRLDSAVAAIPQEASGGMILQTISGMLHYFDPSINARLWVNGPLDPFDTRPALSDRTVFVGGHDQSSWAFRLTDGKQIWRTRFDAPIIDDPVYLNGVVYQAVPGTGLAAMDALTGDILWKNSEVTGGTVITTNKGNLIVWDQADAPARRGGSLYRVDADSGRVIGKANSDLVWYAVADRPQDGNVYALSKSGLVMKLVP